VRTTAGGSPKSSSYLASSHTAMPRELPSQRFRLWPFVSSPSGWSILKRVLNCLASPSTQHERVAEYPRSAGTGGPLEDRVVVKRQSGSHRTLSRTGWADFVFAFHDDEEIGPRMLTRIAKRTGLQPEDL